MPGRLLACALAATMLAMCRPAEPSGPKPSPSQTPSATPAVVIAAPATAILPAVSGLGLAGARDHLSAAEYAAGRPEQVVAVDQVSGWGWADASRRTWTGGGRSVTDLVLRTDRVAGARSALAAWAGDAARAPFSAGPCPASVAGLDECRVGVAGDRSIWVGRLDAEVFRIDAAGLDAAPLAAEQARRLRAGQVGAPTSWLDRRWATRR